MDLLLGSGDKLLVTHRRLFEADAARYFVGEVLAYQDGIVKVRGHSFVRDVSSTRLLRKDDPRTKLVSLSSGAVIAYQLPGDTDVAAVEIVWEGTGLQLKEGGRVLMNLAELPRQHKI